MRWVLTLLVVLQVIEIAAGWWYFNVIHNMVQGLYRKKDEPS
jgi:hypothetical protein